jgi:hypothetical protein
MATASGLSVNVTSGRLRFGFFRLTLLPLFRAVTGSPSPPRAGCH